MRVPRKQTGVALVMALVLLVILSTIAISAARSTTSSIRIVGNMQFKDELEAATQIAIEKTISNLANFDHTTAPGTLLEEVGVDINHDGQDDYVVTAYKPTCRSASVMTGYSATLTGSAPQMSYWDVIAEATVPSTGATVRIGQGVRIALLPHQSCDL